MAWKIYSRKYVSKNSINIIIILSWSAEVSRRFLIEFIIKILSSNEILLSSSFVIVAAVYKKILSTKHNWLVPN